MRYVALTCMLLPAVAPGWHCRRPGFDARGVRSPAMVHMAESVAPPQRHQRPPAEGIADECDLCSNLYLQQLPRQVLKADTLTDV